MHIWCTDITPDDFEACNKHPGCVGEDSSVIFWIGIWGSTTGIELAIELQLRNAAKVPFLDEIANRSITGINDSITVPLFKCQSLKSRFQI